MRKSFLSLMAARSVVAVLMVLCLERPALADTAVSVGCNSVAQRSPSSVAPQPTQIQGAESFIYEQIDGASLRLHVIDPPYHRKSERRAAIVFFFGGAWAVGTVRQFVPQAQYLAQRGMVAIVADYRVRCRQGSTPEDAMVDARRAMRWIRSHATDLGVDPNRLVASGGSAGGHLAVSTALFDGTETSGEDRDTSSKPNALILLNPWLGVAAPADKAFLPDDYHVMAPLEHMRNDLPPTR
jgi:acetyl esterase